MPIDDTKWAKERSEWYSRPKLQPFKEKSVVVERQSSIFYAASGEYIGETRSHTEGGIYIVSESLWSIYSRASDIDAKTLVSFKNMADKTKIGLEYTPVTKLVYNLSDFLYVADVINSEAGGKRENEVLGIAHAIYNESQNTGLSMREQVNEYSTVPDKKKIHKTNNSANSVGVRRAVIHVLTGGADNVNGATHWDGSDFLAWGLSPYDKPHAKFREYGTIHIS